MNISIRHVRTIGACAMVTGLAGCGSADDADKAEQAAESSAPADENAAEENAESEQPQEEGTDLAALEGDWT